MTARTGAGCVAAAGLFLWFSIHPAPAGLQRTVVPQFLLLDDGHLTDVRDRVARGDERLKTALQALEEDARRALAMRPVSVMDKSVVPPSGDKHDYMSQAPYWWPDPSKPDGKPYIRRDGERNPEIARISDHDNLGRLTAAVSALGLAFQLTGRPEYAEHAARLLRVWFIEPATRMNPHLRFGQGIPGITDGRGIGIIETRSLPSMLDGAVAIRTSTAWTQADEAAMQSWMRAYLTWLLESPHGKDEASNGNNHETWYDVQVAGLALYTGQREIARRAIEGSRGRIDRQIEPDGRQPRELARTRAFDYSVMNLTGFFDLAVLGRRVGIDLWNYRSDDGRGIRKALDFLAPYAAGERAWPHQQITPFRPQSLTPLLRRAAVAWNEPKYAALAGTLGGGSYRVELTVPQLVSEIPREQEQGRKGASFSSLSQEKMSPLLPCCSEKV